MAPKVKAKEDSSMKQKSLMAFFSKAQVPSTPGDSASSSKNAKQTPKNITAAARNSGAEKVTPAKSDSSGPMSSQSSYEEPRVVDDTPPTSEVVDIEMLSDDGATRSKVKTVKARIYTFKLAKST
jgi:hypothetical protein